MSAGLDSCTTTFMQQAIPHAVATVRAADQKSPREAVEFVLQLLKYNDNNGNPYSDVYWLAALIQSIGELEFGQQNILFLSSLLKRIDRLLQFDRLMPSYNGVLTISCIRTLTQLALKLSVSVPLDRVVELIKPFRNLETVLWQVRIEASRALLDIELHCNGIDAALKLFMKFLDEEPSLRGQVKLAVHILHLCQLNCGSALPGTIKGPTLVALLRLLESRKAFNNVFLRHHLFCILQILAGRSATLYGAPRVQVRPMMDNDTCGEQKNKPSMLKLRISKPQDPSNDQPTISSDGMPHTEAAKEMDTVSNGHGRKVSVVKLRVKQPAASGAAEDADNAIMEVSRGPAVETDLAGSSSMSVDAPVRMATEPASTSNHNFEEINSSHDHGSRLTASIGSAKIGKSEEINKDLQCTADSRKGAPLEDDRSSPSIKTNDGETEAQRYASIQSLSVRRPDDDNGVLAVENQVSVGKEKKGKKKERKEKKRKREEKGDRGDKHDDPEYLERKRLKKEQKRMEKEVGKLRSVELKPVSTDMQRLEKPVEPKPRSGEIKAEAPEGGSVHKLRIKFKGRSLGNSQENRN